MRPGGVGLKRHAPWLAVVLVSASLVVTSAPASAAGTVTITDVASITEGTSGVFTVTRTDATNAEAIVFGLEFGGSASPADVVVTEGDGGADGILNFGAGTPSQTISILAVDDTDGEPGESVTITLASSNDGSTGLPLSTALTALADNGDAGVISFVAASQGTTETDADFTITTDVQRLGGTEGTVQATVGVTGLDISLVGSTVTFADSNATSQTVTITVVGDDEAEPVLPELHAVTLSGPTNGATLGAQTTHTVSITDDDATPAAADDPGYVIAEDTAAPPPPAIAFSTVLANDLDPDGPGGLATAAVLVTGVVNGVLVFDPTDGTFTYQPDPDFDGVDQFTYQASDGTNTSLTTATVTISVTPVPDAPTAVVDVYAMGEDSTLVVPAGIGVLANDLDPDTGDTKSASLPIGLGPANGELSHLPMARSHTHRT